MSEAYTDHLVKEDESVAERLIDAVVGVSLVTFFMGAVAALQFVPLDTSVLGVRMATVIGFALVATSLGVIGAGVASRLGRIDTDPNRSAGLLAGGAFGAIGLVIGAVAGSYLFGFGSVLWPVVSLASGAGMAVLTIYPREDIGSTVPPALVTLLIGGIIATGVLGIGWQFEPENLGGGFTGSGTIPHLAFIGSLLTAWAGAKARAGFGARGRELGAYVVIYLNAFAMLMVMVMIVVFVASKGAPHAFTNFGLSSSFPFVEWPFVLQGAQLLGPGVSGILPAIVGTFWLVVGATLFAVPLGVGAAIFLTEYAEQGGFTQVVEMATNALWSTPSIVYGLFGAAFLLPRISGNDESLLGGMLVLGFMLLPLVLITSRESIKSVPDGYRDASASMGVSRWETIRSVVLPAALPGIITGVILGIGRIAGETAPLILVLGSTLGATEPIRVLEGFRFTTSPPFVVNDALLSASAALPTQIWAIISAGVSGSPEMGWGTAFILLVVVLSFYAIGITARTYFRRKLYHE
jgi:phosphate transport system permease protein